MILLGLDFETTDKDAEVARVIEIGYAKYDTEGKCFQEKKTILIHDPTITLTEETEKFTGITNEMLNRYGVGRGWGFNQLLSALAFSDYIVAHNAHRYDKIVFMRECERLGLAFPSTKKWVDTIEDVPYTKEASSCKKLLCLSRYHGVAPERSHRALSDVETMFGVMLQYPLEETLKSANDTRVTIEAVTTYEERALPKERGFNWNPNQKKWSKVIRKSKLDEELSLCRFKTNLLFP